MLRLASSWVWDFWTADDGENFHLYFLKASRALIDPDRRHWRATVGHAVSTDLTQWTELADALVPGEDGEFDDLATWTGSIVKADDGSWVMHYTGVNRAGKGIVQRIGAARSHDLHTWTRVPESVVSPDPTWYESLDQGDWPDEAWRDPWVFRDPNGDGWHMLVTARAKTGNPDERGVVGHARSADLTDWEVQPPLSEPNSGFGQLEVLQLADVDGRGVVLFSCMTPELSAERRARGERGGIWAVNAPEGIGRIDVSQAYLLAEEGLYVGRLVQRRDASWAMLAFRNVTEDGGFVGEIIDPIPVVWEGDRLVLRNETSVQSAHPPTERGEHVSADLEKASA